ncbi:hypothetical protein MNBD_UNCLBAC01-382 [hydrothermal vent metagenome]|uniref:Uncharacterized protein n=1 Tax=hydrothermal vent metagenome TaxID=652676 RepID=A0A3B1DJF1_9ZZZZ
MKYLLRLLIFITFLFVSNILLGQNEYAISLENEKIIDFDNREFFIKEVIDKSKKEVFTYSKLGNNRRISMLVYDTDLQSEVKFLFLKSLPEKKNQIGLTLIIDALSSTEDYGEKGEDLKITFQAKLVFEDEVLFINRYEKVFSDAKSYKEYTVFIVQTIQGFIYDFAMVSEPAKSAQVKEPRKEERGNSEDSEEETENLLEEETENLLEENTSRDVVAIGYQIGGFNLIGIDYEFRATDVIGIHAGIGFKGYTAGVKIHFKPTKDGGFINVNYKDGGFGEIDGWAVEYGSRKGFGGNAGGFGFHYQVGLILITNLSPEYRNVFGGATPPFPSISLGIGFSW